MNPPQVPPFDLIDEVDLYGLKVAVVRAALELDVLSVIHEGAATIEQVAATSHCSIRGMTVLIRALTSLGLVESTSTGLRCSPIAAAYLVRGGPGDARHIYLTWLRNRDQLAEAVRTGVGPADHAVDAAEADWSAYAAPELVRWSAEVPGIVERMRERGVLPRPGARVLDLGCGSGIISLAVAWADPDCRVVCVDRPHVLGVARDLATRMGVADRVDFIEGDVEGVELPPAAFDLAVFANVAQYLHDDQVNVTLRRIHESLRSDGALYMTTVVVDDGSVGNDEMWSSAVEMFLASSVDQRSADAVLEQLLDAGFTDVTQPTPSAFLARPAVRSGSM